MSYAKDLRTHYDAIHRRLWGKAPAPPPRPSQLKADYPTIIDPVPLGRQIAHAHGTTYTEMTGRKQTPLTASVREVFAHTLYHKTSNWTVETIAQLLGVKLASAYRMISSTNPRRTANAPASVLPSPPSDTKPIRG